MKQPEGKVTATKGWLVKAYADLRAAKWALKAVPPLSDDALFHCQQVIEKCFKGLLTWSDIQFKKTHDLGELANQCASVGSSFGKIGGEVDALTSSAWEFRYPGETERPTEDQVEDALELAERIYNETLEHLPPETYPSIPPRKRRKKNKHS